ncbi:MAG: transporter [Gammaproteobacteria bacterium]|nr:transporter [Gammaproteobacteria bacterium]
MKHRILFAAALLAATANQPVFANGTVRADSHAPIGVMGDHVHAAGEFMFSYRFMTMEMQGNLQGSSSVDADTIVTTVPNRFAGMPGMPPTLRIVPLDMSMDMHMLGLMYAPTDRLTLMAMTNYWRKSMNHVTYAGGLGTTTLGNFRTESSGWSDSSLTGLISLWKRDTSRVHAILGLSLPTGSTDETAQILTPTNMQPTVRVPYPMQLGSGSYDPIVGATYAGFDRAFAWGAQWRSVFRLSDNDDGYELGDEHRLTGWLSYLFRDPVSASLRLEYYRRGNVSGQDPDIVGPVQTADPDRQAADRMDLAFGLNFAAQDGALHGWRLSFEYVVPVDQDLDGPQLEVDESLMIGVQKAF